MVSFLLAVFFVGVQSSWGQPVTATGKPCFSDALVEDPKEFLDLPDGLAYEILFEAGQTMSDGRAFRARPDLNLYIPFFGPRAFLVTSHELAPDRTPSGSGSLTRSYLVDGKIVDTRLLAEGMRNNCSGVFTPWGTILTNEEFPRDPHEQFPDEGFVWEVDLITGQRFKRTALGRFSHESSIVAPDGSIWMTEDAPGGMLYRFVPKRPGDLSEGTLSVLNTKRRQWVEIREPLKARHEAVSKLAGQLGRLEGLALGPDRKTIYFALTGDEGNQASERFGRIYKLDLKSLKIGIHFEGDGAVMANPDNIAFDKKGNLWILEDQFEPNLDQFGNNEILMMSPKRRVCVFGRLRDFDCEPTGPEFTPDGKNLFLSVQCKRKKDRVVRIFNRNPKKSLVP